jgi:ABC-type glycerol-3-phosphate transport system substrate-binding protein
MKKLLILSAVCLVLMTNIFAQGKVEQPKANEPIELVYWSHFGQSPLFVQSFADASNVALKNLGYTNVTVKAEVIEYSGYESKYLTAFASGKGPDMFLARPSDWALEGGNNPVALPFPADVDKAWTDALANAVKNDGIFGGKRYGFPSEGGSLQLLYINTDYMKEAGLDPEKDIPTNVEEFIEAAKKMTKYDTNGKIVRSGFQPRHLGGGDGITSKFVPMIHIFGGRVLSEDLKTAVGYVNSPDTKAAFQFNQDLVQKYKVTSLEFGAPEATFQSGQTAMIFREGWFAQDTMDKAPNVHFKVVPYIGGKANVAARGGSAWCNMINAKSEHLDIVTALFKELAKEEYDVLLHEPAGYPPVLAATMSMDNEYFKKMPYAEALIGSLPKTSCPIYDASTKYSSVTPLIADAYAAVLNGADVNSTVDKLAKNMQIVLDQE